MSFKRVRGLKKSYSGKNVSEHKKRLTNATGVKSNVKSGVDYGRKKKR